jgi:ribulose 1,5-bisphosphate synthetase/thiazole synthase
VVAGGVIDGVCEVLLDEVVLERELVDDIVDELGVRIDDDDDDVVVVADTVGGFA